MKGPQHEIQDAHTSRQEIRPEEALTQKGRQAHRQERQHQMKTHAGKPTPAKNTTRVPPAGRGITSQYRPGDGPSQPGIVTNERSVLGAGDAHRAEYAAETAKGQAAMRQRIAELNRSEGDAGSTGRDAASAHGGVGDYLSKD